MTMLGLLVRVASAGSTEVYSDAAFVELACVDGRTGAEERYGPVYTDRDASGEQLHLFPSPPGTCDVRADGVPIGTIAHGKWRCNASGCILDPAYAAWLDRVGIARDQPKWVQPREGTNRGHVRTLSTVEVTRRPGPVHIEVDIAGCGSFSGAAHEHPHPRNAAYEPTLVIGPSAHAATTTVACAFSDGVAHCSVDVPAGDRLWLDVYGTVPCELTFPAPAPTPAGGAP